VGIENDTRVALEQALRDEVERHGFRVNVLRIRDRTEGCLPVLLSVDCEGGRRAANYIVERNSADTFLKFSEWLQGGARWPRRTS
jgi:hypothetical protein